MAKPEPQAGGKWWARQLNCFAHPWCVLEVRAHPITGKLGFTTDLGAWKDIAEMDWLGPVYLGDPRKSLPAWSDHKETIWPIEMQGRKTPPVDERLGGYAAPQQSRNGEVEVSAGGLTVWDHYVMAIAPVFVKIGVEQSLVWHEISHDLARFADAMLAERKKRENVDAG